MIQQKMIEKDIVWDEFLSLSLDAQYQVLEFITFLHTRYQSPSSRTTERTEFCSEPFVGMWKDREDMQDSTAYVKKLRHKEWGKS